MPDTDQARRIALLHTIHDANPGSQWTTGRVVQHSLAAGDHGNRHIARADLEALTKDGHLIRREYRGRRFYVLNHARKGGTTR